MDTAQLGGWKQEAHTSLTGHVSHDLGMSPGPGTLSRDTLNKDRHARAGREAGRGGLASKVPMTPHENHTARLALKEAVKLLALIPQMGPGPGKKTCRCRAESAVQQAGLAWGRREAS